MSTRIVFLALVAALCIGPAAALQAGESSLKDRIYEDVKTRRIHSTEGETPEADRRLTLVHLTRKGERRMREIYPRFNAAERDITAVLEEAERDEFVATLRHLLGGIDALEKQQDVKYG